jgi:hypothetical protein
MEMEQIQQMTERQLEKCDAKEEVHHWSQMGA